MDVQQKTREYAEQMVGNQALALCEARARIEALMAEVAALLKERDELKEKAGASES